EVPGQGQPAPPEGAPTGEDAEPQAPAATPVVPVTIGEVADVRLESNPVTSISRVNGEPALTIAITKLPAANTVEVSHEVRGALPELERALDGISLNVVFDQAPYVESSVETLAVEGALGLVFAVLVILVFLLSVRATLVTAISIPVSVLITFIGLQAADYTLNILTLGALTIAIGRVVDDSIVVIENIKRHLVAGADRGPTILFAVKEVASAITASTITTVAVFLPMAFVTGMTGELFRPFAMTVTLALLASLLVSLTIVPVLAYWFLKPEKARPVPANLSAEDAKLLAEEGEGASRVTKLQRAYRPIIRWTLTKPLATLGIAVLTLAGTVALAPLMKTNFIGSDEQNSLSISQTLAPGTSLDEQLRQAERVEALLAEEADVDTVQVALGSSGSGLAAMFGGGGDGVLTYSVTTNPDAGQARLQEELRDRLEDLDDAGAFSLSASGGGGFGQSAIEVQVTAPGQDTLAESAETLVDTLGSLDSLSQVSSNLGTSRPFLSVRADRQQAADAGLSEAALGGIVSAKMQPNSLGQVMLDESSITVYLARPGAPETVAELAAMPVPTLAGEVRLDSLATVEVIDGPVSVTTVQGARSATISATPLGDDLGTASAEIEAALAEIELPAGVTAEVGGVLAQQEEAFQQLGIALLAAILIVYIVMVATFKSLLQPLLLLISVPFAATGTILLQVITGVPLGVASLIGVLMLIGIVVTNAIVLVDLINTLRGRGHPLREAVEFGSLRRLRPILMTALATILALTPMAVGLTGHGGFISQPLAIVVIGGLISSTVMTLVVLPTLYYAVERARERSRERRAARGDAVAAPGAAHLAVPVLGDAGAASAPALPGADAGPAAGAEHAQHAARDRGIDPELDETIRTRPRDPSASAEPAVRPDPGAPDAGPDSPDATTPTKDPL
ncbi:efflux RND transporter permease subunit, partial [Leucobacter sp. M11]|uniref:efflux RND transporter permease subunit n=1 Tax=Leucobacter sp. M11 TaxID=2993565 RepID=UPI002D7E7EFF